MNQQGETTELGHSQGRPKSCTIQDRISSNCLYRRLPPNFPPLLSGEENVFHNVLTAPRSRVPSFGPDTQSRLGRLHMREGRAGCKAPLPTWVRLAWLKSLISMAVALFLTSGPWSCRTSASLCLAGISVSWRTGTVGKGWKQKGTPPEAPWTEHASCCHVPLPCDASRSLRLLLGNHSSSATRSLCPCDQDLTKAQHIPTTVSLLCENQKPTGTGNVIWCYVTFIKVHFGPLLVWIPHGLTFL